MRNLNEFPAPGELLFWAVLSSATANRVGLVKMEVLTADRSLGRQVPDRIMTQGFHESRVLRRWSIGAARHCVRTSVVRDRVLTGARWSR